jgi:hypothetical protein
MHQHQGQLFDLTLTAFPQRNAKRQDIKEVALAILGGKCYCPGCDYKGPALQFHHRDPKSKSFGISQGIHSGLPWKVLEPEIRKCILLCSNHHIEWHAKHD